MNWYKIIKISKKIKKKFIHTFGDVKVYIVDGEEVRDSSEEAEEFGLSGCHNFHDFIPENEIWIENDVKEDEIPVLIHSRLLEIKYSNDGESKYDAYHHSIAHEKEYRNKRESSKKALNKKDISDDMYIKKYGEIDGVEVWIVDGEKARDDFKKDGLEGWHGYVYDFVPKNEIWIENGIHEKEIPIILLHEFVERTIMKEENIDYDKAHIIAAKIEFDYRKKDITKDEILNFTEDKALKISNKYKE